MIEKIEYSYPLDYEDVLQFIQMLTLDNNVKTDKNLLRIYDDENPYLLFYEKWI